MLAWLGLQSPGLVPRTSGFSPSLQITSPKWILLAKFSGERGKEIQSHHTESIEETVSTRAPLADTNSYCVSVPLSAADSEFNVDVV
jgi:hypothetical protein